MLGKARQLVDHVPTENRSADGKERLEQRNNGWIVDVMELTQSELSLSPISPLDRFLPRFQPTPPFLCRVVYLPGDLPLVRNLFVSQQLPTDRLQPQLAHGFLLNVPV